MLNNEQIEKVTKQIYNRLQNYNTEILKKIAQRVKEIGTITPSDVQRLNILAEVGVDIAQIEEELYYIYEETAKSNINFADKYYKYRELPTPTIDNNKYMSDIIESVSIQTEGMINNISRSIAFAIPIDNKITYKSLREVYINTIDQAILETSLGLESYQSTMRKTLKKLADSGIRTVDYASGYSQRIDSAVRRNILDGTRQINQRMQEQIGKEIGADGVELSMHDACAPDHLEIQGKQYSNDEYKKLNERLMRPIGTLNCKHFAFPIVLGVSEPVHSDVQIKQNIARNNKQYEFEGKKYTKYEGTQVQRQLETKIRKKKDEYLILKEFGDKEGMAEIRNEISILRTKYITFSDKLDISPKLNRASVRGYK